MNRFAHSGYSRVAAALLAFLPLTATAAETATPVPWVSLRARHESVDEASFTRSAYADTLRLRFGYQTRPWRQISLRLEVDHLSALGSERFNSTRNGSIDRPLIPDPPATDLNEALLEFSTNKERIRLGRQRLTFDNQRFVGAVGWRQNEQTFDALLVESRRWKNWLLSWAHVNNVNRVFGPDRGTPPADFGTGADFLHAQRDLAQAGKLSAFAYSIDLRNAMSQSNRSVGFLYTGQHALKAEPWSFPWSMSYAVQTDTGDNPNNYRAKYWQLETGLTRGHLGFRVGQEVLSGHASMLERRFQTPLATLHSFQGWADRFLTTPAQGVDDFYLIGTWQHPKFEARLAWHDYRAEAVHRHYGEEWNALVSVRPSPRLELLIKYADYRADTFSTDTQKLWLQASLALL